MHDECLDVWVQAPEERFLLALQPTPIHAWHPPDVPEGVQVWIKRDDLSGMQLSGNKVRIRRVA